MVFKPWHRNPLPKTATLLSELCGAQHKVRQKKFYRLINSLNFNPYLLTDLQSLFLKNVVKL